MAVAAALILAIIAAAAAGGFRINLTPSEPLGLWRIEPLHRPPAVGDLVFACPPLNPVMREARERGYLRSGLCPGGFAPLIKTVIAVAGQQIDIGTVVRVNGEEVANSPIVNTDGEGRTLRSFASGPVPPDAVFLHSSFSGSYDSRYFGPIPASGILGLAAEVLTHVP